MAHWYYRIGSAIGYAAAVICVVAYMRTRVLSVLHWYYLIPLVVAVLSGELVAYRIDVSALRLRDDLLSPVLFAIVIFLVSAFVGCLCNFFLNGVLLNQDSDLNAWFLRPLIWISTLGVPGAVVIAVLYRWAAPTD